jgi:hypothetical protein
MTPKPSLMYPIYNNKVSAICRFINTFSCSAQAFVHFSTAYSNCTIKEIGERFYSPPLRWTDLVQLTESLDEKTIEMITPTYVQKLK